jgi:hypothetical protein
MHLLLVVIAITVVAGETYSDKVVIDGFGEITLPPGKWLLEHAVTEKKGLPDVYVFKKSGDRLERLTFQKFDQKIAFGIHNYIDSIGDGVSNGIPVHLLKNKDEYAHEAFQTLRPTTKLGETCLLKSLIYTSETRDPWMGNAFVCKWKQGVLVCIHASPMRSLRRQSWRSIRICDRRQRPIEAATSHHQSFRTVPSSSLHCWHTLTERLGWSRSVNATSDII